MTQTDRRPTDRPTSRDASHLKNHYEAEEEEQESCLTYILVGTTVFVDFVGEAS